MEIHVVISYLLKARQTNRRVKMTEDEGLKLALERSDDMHYKTNVQANNK